LALVGAIAFSGKAIIVKLAYRYNVDAVTLIMLRMLFALPFFAAMAWWAGRGQPRADRRDAWACCGWASPGYYLASFLDFAGLAVHHRLAGAAHRLSQPHAGAAAGLADARSAHPPPQVVAMA
jgi:drug/metabolite transporter (DMT)-like permease